MNIIDIIVLAILALSLVSGMYKGFITSTLALIGFAGSWIGALVAYPHLVTAIRSNESLMTFFSGISNAVDLNIGSVGNLTVFQATEADIASAVDRINVPLLGNLFKENVLGKVFQNQGIDTLNGYLSETILSTALNVLCFILTFIVIYAAVLLLINLLNNVFRFPALRHLDWFMGGVFGLARGVVILFLLAAVLSPVASALDSMKVTVLSDLIKESSLAKILFENNFIQTALQHLA